MYIAGRNWHMGLPFLVDGRHFLCPVNSDMQWVMQITIIYANTVFLHELAHFACSGLGKVFGFCRNLFLQGVNWKWKITWVMQAELNKLKLLLKSNSSPWPLLDCSGLWHANPYCSAGATNVTLSRGLVASLGGNKGPTLIRACGTVMSELMSWLLCLFCTAVYLKAQ